MKKVFIIHDRSVAQEFLKDVKILSSKNKLKEYLETNFSNKEIKDMLDDEITNGGFRLTGVVISDIPKDKKPKKPGAMSFIKSKGLVEEFKKFKEQNEA